MTVTTFHVGEVNLPTTNAFRFRPFTLSPPAPIYVPPAGIDVFQIKQVLLPKAASITSSPSSKGPVEFSRQPKLCLHSHKKTQKKHIMSMLQVQQNVWRFLNSGLCSNLSRRVTATCRSVE